MIPQSSGYRVSPRGCRLGALVTGHFLGGGCAPYIMCVEFGPPPGRIAPLQIMFGYQLRSRRRSLRRVVWSHQLGAVS